MWMKALLLSISLLLPTTSPFLLISLDICIGGNFCGGELVFEGSSRTIEQKSGQCVVLTKFILFYTLYSQLCRKDSYGFGRSWKQAYYRRRKNESRLLVQKEIFKYLVEKLVDTLKIDSH